MARTPTYTPHLLYQVNGQLGPAGSAWEIFSYSIRMGTPGTVGGVETDAGKINDTIDDILSFHGDTRAHISKFARVTNVKAALVLPDGKWQGAAPLVSRTVDVAGARAGNNVTLPGAPQVALAVTLRTAVNSARHRGRFYLPLPDMPPMGVDGLLADGDVTDVATAAGELIKNMNERPGLSADTDRVVVASTFGGLYQVTGVSVGRVLDTIRSRRNALREAYVSHGVS